MTALKHILLFLNNDRRELQRKWKSLPFLFLYPICLLILVSFIIVSLFTYSKDEAIQVSLIDLDQTEETKLVINILEQSNQLSAYLNLRQTTEQEAIKQIESDEISAYITFPTNFTTKLYEGEKVQLHIVGNPQKKTDSFLINEFVTSITRHIRSSQANIVTIYNYAKKMDMPPNVRNDFLYEQFTEFFLYALDKDRTIQENEVTNVATAAPKYYFFLGSWLIITTIWLLSFYLLLYRTEEKTMLQRLSLYGVQHIQKVVARMIITLLVTAISSISLFYSMDKIIHFHLPIKNYMKVGYVAFLYSLVYLFSLAIIELTFTSKRLQLFVQMSFTMLCILLSGAIVPSLYFPLSWQPLMTYIFSNKTFHFIQEIVLYDQALIDYKPLILMNVIAMLILGSLSSWKERSQ